MSLASAELRFSEIRRSALSLGIELFDGFHFRSRLAGEVTVRLENQPIVPIAKRDRATFLFLDLPPGPYTVQVESAPQTPFYLPVEVAVAVPLADPLWPALPEIRLADPARPLDDPAQPAAYRAQRAALTLQPAIAYPFPHGATVVRGTVVAAGAPLAAARVRRPGDDLDYTTGEDGQFVLFFHDLSGMGETVTLRASHALHPDVDQAVDVRRGLTAATEITMAP